MQPLSRADQRLRNRIDNTLEAVWFGQETQGRIDHNGRTISVIRMGEHFVVENNGAKRVSERQEASDEIWAMLQA